MITLAVTARCHVCDEQPEGDPDKWSAKHTKATGHATAVTASPLRDIAKLACALAVILVVGCVMVPW